MTTHHVSDAERDRLHPVSLHGLIQRVMGKAGNEDVMRGAAVATV